MLTQPVNKDTIVPMDSSSEKLEKVRAMLKGKTKEELSRIKACCRMIKAQREVAKAKREVDAMDDEPAASDDSHRLP